MKLKLIAAVCEYNNGIGKDNKIPWKKKADLKFFSKMTKKNKKNAVLMGTNTWYSLPGELKDRLNIVIGSSLKGKPDTVLNFHTLKEGVDYCKRSKDLEEIWVIGGSKIYNSVIDEFYEDIDEIVITWIKEYYECDTFFPKLDENFVLYKNRYIGEEYELKVGYYKKTNK